MWTTLFRGIIYCALLPLAWWVLDTGTIIDGRYPKAMFATVTLLFLLDGAQVAFASVVDIDMGGTDILAQQHGIKVDDATRNHMNLVHQISMDAGMIVFSPLIACFSYWLAKRLGSDSQSAGGLSTRALDSGSLVAGVGAIFLVTTLASMMYYGGGIPSERVSAGGALRPRRAAAAAAGPIQAAPAGGGQGRRRHCTCKST